MKKVSFFGNCQLENIANLVKNVTQQHPQLEIEVLWTKAAYLTKPEEYIAVMFALSNSDLIYTQYHEKRWGLFATELLKKSFDMKIVPTLESHASVPQTGECNIEPNLASLNIHYLDFRILDLYLKDIPAEQVPEQYFAIAPRAGAIDDQIRKTTEKYREYFKTGKVMLDYSGFYEESMKANLLSFHTFNHPNNKQLEWMLNGIMRDLGVTVNINLDGPEMLNQFQMPSLLNDTQREYEIFQAKLPLNAVAKIFYNYFNAIDREILVSEFKKSPYYSLMDVQ